MLLTGKAVAEKINQEILEQTPAFYAQNIVPTVAIVRNGYKKSDIAYEENAIKKAKSLGLVAEKYTCPRFFQEDDLVDVINVINDNKDIHGILLLQPLPNYMNLDRVRNTLAPEKDIDGVTDASLKDIFIKGKGFAPCTAESCMEILKYYNIPLEGKKVVVIGRSIVVGKPLSMLLLKENASVTICHSKTSKEDLTSYCKNADIIICAAGVKNILTADMVKEGQTVIDVGINFNEEGKMVGDVDFEGVEPIVENITPVPGGVGSVTTSLLMKHLVDAAKKNLGIE